MGIHRLDSYTLDLCEELKKLKQGNPEDEYPVCPIPAERKFLSSPKPYTDDNVSLQTT
jgi:hypothetical protein